jgi:hypothetical protein
VIFVLPLAIAFALVALALFLYLDRWRARRAARRAIVMPPAENGFTVAVTDKDVFCTRPDGTVERVAWNDLQTVELVRAGEDDGWILDGSSGTCTIPRGASGEGALLDRLQGLAGFDNGAVVAAMGRSDNHRTLCWRRLRPPGER